MVGEEEGKKGRVGEKGSARTQNIGLVAPARMVRQGLSRQCMWRDREGHTGPALALPVVPHALARQRLSVAPGQVARPNGLLPANKIQYGLKLK